MDPITVAILQLAGKIVDKTSAEEIAKHEARADQIWNWVCHLPGSPFKPDAPVAPKP